MAACRPPPPRTLCLPPSKRAERVAAHGSAQGHGRGGFSSVWVAGEISNFSQPQSGHATSRSRTTRPNCAPCCGGRRPRGSSCSCTTGSRWSATGGSTCIRRAAATSWSSTSCSPRASAPWSWRCGSCARSSPRGTVRSRAQAAAAAVSAPDRRGHEPDGRGDSRLSRGAGRRWRGVETFIFPARVQGDGAADEIVAAIRAGESSDTAARCARAGPRRRQPRRPVVLQ